MIVIIFGVAGAGKTTIGELLARELGWKFYEGDDFHPPANIDKMEQGKPLTDQDRQPWLEKLRKVVQRVTAANENAVLACSALKKKYRDQLQVSSEVAHELPSNSNPGADIFSIRSFSPVSLQISKNRERRRMRLQLISKASRKSWLNELKRS